jgi:Fe-S-cluster containining protein
MNTRKNQKERMESFECQGCGACCRIPNGIVRVSESEISRIAAFLGMAESEFIANETDVAPDRKGLVLKSRTDDSCVWLTEDNRCRIHPVKPDKCRTFPYEWINSDSHEICAGLKKLNRLLTID